MPSSIENLVEKLMIKPKKILVKAEQLTLEGIDQYYVALENDKDKYSALKDLYGLYSVSQCIIYCNSVNRVEYLYNCMMEDNFPVSQIHSNMDKEQRKLSYNDFINGKTRVLISSNVTSRGIDVQQVSIVINFDIPNCQHNYLHRIGRSGRWGRKGMGINFVTRRDINIMKDIEKFYSTEIKELPNNIVEKNKT
jgi:translation initiation factor 4A